MGEAGKGTVVRLEPGVSPKAIDILGAGESGPNLGVYELPAPNQLRLRLSKAGDADRPASADKDGVPVTQTYIELERQE